MYHILEKAGNGNAGLDPRARFGLEVICYEAMERKDSIKDCLYMYILRADKNYYAACAKST